MITGVGRAACCPCPARASPCLDCGIDSVSEAPISPESAAALKAAAAPALPVSAESSGRGEPACTGVDSRMSTARRPTTSEADRARRCPLCICDTPSRSVPDSDASEPAANSLEACAPVPVRWRRACGAPRFLSRLIRGARPPQSEETLLEELAALCLVPSFPEAPSNAVRFSSLGSLSALLGAALLRRPVSRPLLLPSTECARGDAALDALVAEDGPPFPPRGLLLVPRPLALSAEPGRPTRESARPRWTDRADLALFGGTPLCSS